MFKPSFVFFVLRQLQFTLLASSSDCFQITRASTSGILLNLMHHTFVVSFLLYSFHMFFTGVLWTERMPHYVTFGCNNQSNYVNKILYHQLPKNNVVQKVWMDAIGITALPCLDHFEDECFDKSHELKSQLLPEGSSRQ